MSKNNLCNDPTCWEDCEPFRCLNCTVNTLHINEYYMITDALWGRVEAMLFNWFDLLDEPHPEHMMMCIGCVEKYLGERLLPEDFTDAPINRLVDGPFAQSPRLINRLGGPVTLEEADAWAERLYDDPSRFLR